MPSETGWKPIPLSLKILSVLLGLWVVGSFFAIAPRMEQGLPFFGLWVDGMVAALIVIALDIVGPAAFLYALWTRKSWGPTVAFGYMGIFILNSVVAAFTVSEQLGVGPIIGPAVFTSVLMFLIYRKKDYFE